MRYHIQDSYDLESQGEKYLNLRSGKVMESQEFFSRRLESQGKILSIFCHRFSEAPFLRTC